MNKLMIAALGLSLLSGSVVFAQDAPKTDDTKKSDTAKTKKHKKSKKTETAPATDSSAPKK